MIAFMTIIYVATVALVFKVGRRTGQSEILGGRGEPATGNSRREPGGQGPAIGHQRRGHREGPIGFGQVQSRSNHDHGSGRRLRYRLADPRRQHGQPSRYDGRRYVHRDIRNIHCRFVRGRGTDPRPARPGRRTWPSRAGPGICFTAKSRTSSRPPVKVSSPPAASCLRPRRSARTASWPLRSGLPTKSRPPLSPWEHRPRLPFIPIGESLSR